MEFATGMATGLLLIHIVGAYLRYLAFETRLTREERARLWKYILLWTPAAFALYTAYFADGGVDVEKYKFIHYVGWIPFFAISVHVIRHEWMRHIFVGGMQTLWFLLLQTMSGTLILTMLPPYYGTGINRIPVQTGFYLCFFLLLLPLEQRFFRSLLPPTLFTGSRMASWCFALMPFGLCISPIITLIERPLMYSWTDRFSRFFLMFWGFMLYQYALYAGERAARIRDNRHTNELLAQQIRTLKSQAVLMQARANDVRRMRHDLRHHNRILVSLLREGKTEEIYKLLEAQDKELLAPPADAYCKNPIVNAALTAYVQMARLEDIPISCRVDIESSDVLGGGENDLAILLSNVIENAIIASRKQPENRREIRVSLSAMEGHFVLAVENRFDSSIRLGEDGLPMTAESGHGIGMVSLKNFARKYDAQYFFEQAGGWVRLFMYWG
ncbi:MAG: GHKL domain-containing protein [Schwartzia sp.]|nr:GHKL domain-containing protein [Schwartzia sp. (in: firmicutes)]